MHDIIYGIGYLSIFAIFFYALHLYMEKDKPSDFELVRNRLQRITHPHLIVLGHGRYFIEYKDRYEHVFHYYNFSEYKEWLAHYKECEDINIIKHGLSSNRAWEKWDIKK